MGQGQRAPKNTSTESVGMGSVLVEGIAFEGKGVMERKDVLGQKSLINSDTLPNIVYHGDGEDHRCDCDPKAILEAAGVIFLDLVKGDPLFRFVELPEGWEIVSTDHPMYTSLVDDKGRERASIFYKTAPYDRLSSMGLCRRYQIRFDDDLYDQEKVGVVRVMDGSIVIHSTEPIPQGDKSYDEMSSKAHDLAKQWLDANYPDWKNPGAYWD